MTSFNPHATYRGYRKQALYALYRIMLDPGAADKTYQPEGDEDLSVRSVNGTLLEAIQVKDYGAPLTFSHFDPDQPKSFFYRVRDRLQNEPQATNKLASYGPLGPDLASALGKNPAPSTATEKLVQSSNKAKAKAEKTGRPFQPLQIGEAQTTLSSIIVEEVGEAELLEALREIIRQSIMGSCPDVALGLLMFWIFQASETTKPLTQQEVLRKANQIGNYLAGLQSFHQEWNRAITPLEVMDLSEEETSSLKESFEQGIQASWKHILAGVDLERPAKLADLEMKFGQANTVIIHGASGQGKSTLAYRYFFDNCPEGCRFLVNAIVGRQHALNVVNALAAHAAAMGIRAHVLLDVRPNDNGWTDLAIGLADMSEIRTLVVVREEDYRRAHFDQSSIKLESLSLDTLTEEEAQTIYASLATKDSPNRFLSFEDAWTRFGGAGPLMEFTYLLTQGQTLRKKLASQLDKLECEANAGAGDMTPKHLDLLMLVSIAGAFECRLGAVSTCEAVGFRPISNPFSRFEDEFMVLRQAEYGAVGGLHALRSEIICDHLLRVSPDLWIRYAVQCLPLLMPGNMDAFLLCAFSRKPEHAEALIGGLYSLSAPTWETVGAIVRSILWLGLSRYEIANHDGISMLMKAVGDGWLFHFDAFLGEHGNETFLKMRQSVIAINPKTVHLMEEAHQTPKDTAFAPFRAWAERSRVVPPQPSTPEDWTGLADTAFWIGCLKIKGCLLEAFDEVNYGSALAMLSVKELSELVWGLFQTGSSSFQAWRKSQQAELLERFKLETGSLEVEFSLRRICVKFLLELGTGATGPSSGGNSDWNTQSIVRLRVLRGLVPDVDVYSARGLGLEALPFKIGDDPFTCDIPAANLRPENITRINGTFHAMVLLRHSRLPNWNNYIDAIMASRNVVQAVLRRLRRGLDGILEKRGFAALWDGCLTEAEWDKARAGLTLPHFPQCAVDEWGFTSETRQALGADFDSVPLRQSAALDAYRPYLVSAREFTISLGTFMSQFRVASHLCLAQRKACGDQARLELFLKGDPFLDDREHARKLCLFNLHKALERLPEFQSLFRGMFGSRVLTAKLDELEHAERRTMEDLFGPCRELMISPARVLSGATVFCLNADKSNRKRFLHLLGLELCELVSDGIISSIAKDNGRWGGAGALWLTASVTDAHKLPTVFKPVSQAFVAALKMCGFSEWESGPLQREWRHVVVAVQFRGRSLERCAHAMSSSFFFVLQGESFGEVTGSISMPVADGDLPDTLQIWDHPTALLCMRWLASTQCFFIFFEQTKHLFAAVNETGPTAEPLGPLVERFSRKLSSTLNPAVEAHQAFLGHLQSRARPGAACAEECSSIAARLEAWGAKVLPKLESSTGTIDLEFAAYLRWYSRIATANLDTLEIVEETLERLLPAD